LAFHALWLHGSWEAAQCAYFYDMSGALPLFAIALMIGATLADVALTLLLVAIALRRSAQNAGFSLLRTAPRLIVVGAATALFIEAGAQAAGWWRYSTAMPVFPLFERQIGVLPLLQMALLPLLCLIFASKRLHTR
jgi:hypothetical protein